MKLKRWLLLGGKMILWSFIFTVIFALFTSISSSHTESILDEAANYYLYGTMLFIIIMSPTCYRAYMPMYMSFGSTRRDACLGMHIMQLIPTAAAVVITAIFATVSGEAGYIKMLPMEALALLLAGALGSLMGCMELKFKVLSKVIMVVVFAACGGVFGFIMSSGQRISGGIDWSFHGKTFAIMLAVTAAVYIAEIIVQRIVMRRYEVKI